MVSIFVHIFAHFHSSPQPKAASPRGGELLKWHVLQSLSKIGVLTSLNDKEKTFAECLKDQIM